MSQYGEIEDMIVVDNLGDHIVGNVYVKYSDEDYSENALKNVNGRFWNGKKISAVFSPVTDFLNAKCKQYIDGSCKRGGYCNYMHVKPLSKSFKKELFQQMYLEHPEYRLKKRSESEDSFERRKRERRDRKEKKDKDRKSKKKEERSKSKDRRRSRSREEKKQKRRHSG
jgi:splicing factor U2AF 35 kDa subunit